MFDIPCVIFAGGKSSRMGEDKSLLPFGGFDTLTEYQYSKLSKIFKKVYISCKNKNKFASLIEQDGIEFIEDIASYDIFAPTVAFVSIFQELGQHSFFAISVDTPFIEKKHIEKIIQEDTLHVDATVAKIASGIQPLCGIYHGSMRNKFNYMLNNGEHKLGLLLKNSKSIFVEFEDESGFLNINHLHDYQEALTLI